jgi:WD40 repeat protein
MAAYAWVLQGKVTGPRTLLLDQSGTHINAIAATNRWFIVVDAGSNLWDAIRPSMRWDHLDKPCGEHNILTAIAVAHDDKRIALACTGVGIRIVDLESGRQLSKDAPNTAADELVWSPDGHRLATRSDGAIRVWRGPLLVTSIPEPGGGGLWWDSASAVGGELYGELAEWSVPEGVKHPDRVELRSERTARSPHGEIIAASRVMSGTVDQVTILRGDRRDTFDLPDTKIDWIDGLAISDSGAHAVLWRGQYNGKPGTEVIAIDVATHAIQLATGTITAAAIDDATLVTASAGGELVRRAGGAAKKLGDHGGDVTALAIRGDLVTAGGTDGTISVWSLARGALGTLRGHTAAIRALAISSDGTHLASTAADGTLTWDLSP